MLKPASAQRHPFISLLLLLLLMIAGAVTFMLLAFIAVITIYGMKEMLNASTGSASSIEVIKLLQLFISTGMFIVPALFFARLESQNWTAYLRLKEFPSVLILITLLIMISSGPMLELSAELNRNMNLPYFLRDLEQWMLIKELEMSEMTKQLLTMNTPGVLIFNIFMLAIIPAVGEELIFRGCLQKIFAKWTGNKHVAIWVTAIIFSAIHVQFYGFLPRMLLGALFGYLLVWSRTIWIPILSHFINNAVAVITAFVYQQKGISLDKLEQPDPVAYYVYIISFLACSFLLWIFYTTSLRYSLNLSDRTDGSRLD
ncbi:CPBP family intramembrane glutamic endopeptidase [Daejeonella sp.]|uniref:CPBP family intramembrane glutamic endopeptidase n=1 Tax=Daejeonella sp. TaxID=2805397 RepID=UPI0039837E36